jgi:hypothetical protein
VALLEDPLLEAPLVEAALLEGALLGVEALDGEAGSGVLLWPRSATNHTITSRTIATRAI